MTETSQESKYSIKKASESKFWRIVLVLLAVSLTFLGPTYIVYVLSNALEINFFVSMALGFSCLIAGLVLLWYLIRIKVIS